MFDRFWHICLSLIIYWAKRSKLLLIYIIRIPPAISRLFFFLNQINRYAGYIEVEAGKFLFVFLLLFNLFKRPPPVLFRSLVMIFVKFWMQILHIGKVNEFLQSLFRFLCFCFLVRFKKFIVLVYVIAGWFYSFGRFT